VSYVAVWLLSIRSYIAGSGQILVAAMAVDNVLDVLEYGARLVCSV
jgi:uncharacterized protein YuzB (UPF0349 family)